MRVFFLFSFGKSNKKLIAWKQLMSRCFCRCCRKLNTGRNDAWLAERNRSFSPKGMLLKVIEGLVEAMGGLQMKEAGCCVLISFSSTFF